MKDSHILCDDDGNVDDDENDHEDGQDDAEDDHDKDDGDDDDDETDKIVTCLTETWVLKGSQILFGTNLVLSSFCAENFFILCPEAIVM